jgi:hypothetical protein
LKRLVAICGRKRSPLIPLKKGDFVLSFPSSSGIGRFTSIKLKSGLFSPLFSRGAGGDLLQEVKFIPTVSSSSLFLKAYMDNEEFL